MLLGTKPAKQAATPADSNALIRDVTVESFERDVIQASLQMPIVVDFWAPWCGPCKQLGPMLEKAVLATAGKIRMAKVNIDENPEIAQALRVQSIPTVYAFFQGRPLDGFMGAVPESQIKSFIDKLLSVSGAGPNPVDALLDRAKHAILEGHADIAGHIYSEILAGDPAHATARASLAKLLLDQGDAAAAKKLIDEALPEIAKHAEILAVKIALDLADQAAHSGAARELAAKLAINENDHQTRFDLAMAYYAEGKREAAVDELLEIVRRDRAWNDDEARKQLVKFFEAFGSTDPLTIAARKRLSSILFA